MKNKAFFTAIILLSSITATAKVTENFERARFKKAVSLAESQFAYNENVKQNCYVYSQHAVVEVIDPGLTGSKISIRPKDRSVTNDEICSETYQGRQIFLNNKATYFWGTYQRYIFVRAADDFSDRERFEVFDSMTGENLWNAHRNNGKKFDLVTKVQKTSLTYYHHLKIFCNIAQDKKGLCWKRVYLDYKIPEDVKISPPNCAAVLKDSQLSPTSQVYVFLPVVLRDLAKPKIKYLPGAATCSVAP